MGTFLTSLDKAEKIIDKVKEIQYIEPKKIKEKIHPQWAACSLAPSGLRSGGFFFLRDL
jgi:hypothetical protein